ncbi:MAG TPA: type VI secretion system baseplate subunit TssE [Polyangia bacterium]
MVEFYSRDRLQPSLLDRLTDHHPLERQEPVEARVLTRQQLRSAILRDLTWLFNAIRSEPEPASTRVQELDLWARHKHASQSVLNFGMPAFSGTTKSSLNRPAMEAAVRQAITTFEPRIDAKSLSVKIEIDPMRHHNVLQLTLRCEMWAQPVPLEVLLAADVDLETGNARLRALV